MTTRLSLEHRLRAIARRDDTNAVIRLEEHVDEVRGGPGRALVGAEIAAAEERAERFETLEDVIGKVAMVATVAAMLWLVANWSSATAAELGAPPLLGALSAWLAWLRRDDRIARRLARWESGLKHYGR